jgi:CIC family chloride channel protein
VGYGHLAVHLEVFGRMPWYLLLALALGAIVATSITLNFGGSGGVFTPALYIGAATGGAVGVALATLFPDAGVRPEAFAIVGMGATVAGALNAPITGILLVFEMTNDYALMVPLMLTVVVCQAVTRRWERDSLYTGWLRRRGLHLEHGTDRDALAALLVRDAFDPAPIVIREDEPAGTLLRHLGNNEQSRFPVVDAQGLLLGVISAGELGQVAVGRSDVERLLLAADLAGPTESVVPDDTLLTAVRKMGARGADALPVLHAASGRLAGMVSRHHVLQAYQRRMGG